MSFRLRNQTIKSTIAPEQHKGTGEVIEYLSYLMARHLDSDHRVHTEVHQNTDNKFTVSAYYSIPIEGQKDKRDIRGLHSVGDFFLEEDGTVRVLKKIRMPNGQVPQFNNWHTLEYAEELAFVPHD